MALTRREICALLPAFAAIAVLPSEAAEKGTSGQMTLPSKIYDADHMPVKNKKDQQRTPLFKGVTYSGMPLSLHNTALAPGGVVHGISSHLGDELFLVREGVLEVEFNGKRWEVSPGSVAYVASETPYAIRNTGTEWARYFVLFFGPSHPPVGGSAVGP
ncbi:MAG: cupin domain-containing protein [Acidobacteriaceae bacterium]